MKKIIALILALILCSSTLIMASAEHCNVTPVIYIYGDDSIYWRDEDGNQYEKYEDGDYVQAILQNCIPSLLKGITTGDYDEYCEKVLDIVLPAFDHIAPRLDGTMPPESYQGYRWDKNSIARVNHTRNLVNWDGSYHYGFRIDQRKSPLDVADDLNNFIEEVKRQTGHSKVSILARCLGGTALYAYLYEYQRDIDYAGIENVVVVATTANGSADAEAIYTGNVKLNSEGINAMLANYTTQDGIVSDELGVILNTIIPVLRDSYGLNITADFAQKLYDAMKDKLFAKIIKAYYGRQLSYIACIKDNWDDVIPYIFGEEGDDVTYAYFIDKITEYHETVQASIDDMLLELNQKGKVNIIANYGILQRFPVSDDAVLTGDYQVGTRQMSWGATVAKFNGKLDEKYVEKQKAAGLGKYISVDNMVDASTCLLPDNTFFIKNNDHQWPDQMHALATLLLRNAYSNVNTYPQYPQFTNYDPAKPALEPLQEVNSTDLDYNSKVDKEEAYTNFFDLINSYIIKIYTKIFNFIKEFAQLLHF